MKTPNPLQKKLWFLLGLGLLTQQGLKMLEALLQMGRLRHKASWRWMFHFAGLWSCFGTFTQPKHDRSLTQSDLRSLRALGIQSFFWGGWLVLTRQDKIKDEDPQPTSKKTLVSAWPWALDPTRLKDVRGLAADGSSETQGLLKMNVSLCWAVVVLWNFYSTPTWSKSDSVWLALTSRTWNPKFFLRWVVGQQDKTR